MNYQYSYLIGTIIMLIIWFILFFWRKDTRKEMIFISIIFLIAGFMEIPYTKDWWKPLTITNTIPGIESFLFCFSFAGIVAVLYTHIFRKRIMFKKLKKHKKNLKNINFLTLLLITGLLFVGGFYLLKLNTLQATIISLITGTLYLWSKRKDFITNSIITGILTIFIMFPVFWIVESITPGVVQEFWLFQNLPNIVILKMPIDDLIFYFLAGLFIGPLYEYWQEGKLGNKENKQYRRH